MTSPRSDKPSPGGASRWLGIGGGVALALAVLVLLFAWQRETDERRKSEQFKAHVAAEMNRIESEAQRMEREAGQ